MLWPTTWVYVSCVVPKIMYNCSVTQHSALCCEVLLHCLGLIFVYQMHSMHGFDSVELFFINMFCIASVQCDVFVTFFRCHPKWILLYLTSTYKYFCPQVQLVFIKYEYFEEWVWDVVTSRVYGVVPQLKVIHFSCLSTTSPSAVT